MIDRLALEISRIGVEDWTSLADLSGTRHLFGDLRIEIGGQQIPGVHIERPGEAHLNKCVSELIGLRQIQKQKVSYKISFHAASPVGYKVTRDGDLLTLVPAARTKRASASSEGWQMQYEQVLDELAKFTSKMRALMLASCPAEAVEYWWYLNAHERFADAVKKLEARSRGEKG